MDTVRLNKINRFGKKIQYEFEVTEGLEVFFSGDSFVIEYPEEIESVPNAVLAVPFVCNVLPIIWLKDVELIISELDEDFYNSIPEFKKGYINMYPTAKFKGKITVEKIVNCGREHQSGAAAFFSGGLDATTTLLRHLDEKPDLISIWGSDIAFDNEEGWKPIQSAIDQIAVEYGVQHINIHSSFRQFDSERELGKEHVRELPGGWWHDVKHGLGIIGHSAPYVWLKSIKTVYIASSNSPQDKNVKCASHPSIDNFIRFCGAGVVHDGFELGRQGKTRYLTKYHKDNPNRRIMLHVCWESTNGENCYRCEKCLRTMMGFWAEGDDPRYYGLFYPKETFHVLYQKIALEYEWNPTKIEVWRRIQEAMILNHHFLVHMPYYKEVRWLEKYNFEDPEKNWGRKIFHAKNAKSIRKKLSYFWFYQKLHQLKAILRGTEK